jgi:adenine-specific DNA-methyltransferase
MSSKDTPETMDLRSMDIKAENRGRLKALFPTVFTETANEKGEPVEAIDFEKLKAELGTFSEVFEARRERYGMDWPGKKDCMKLIQQPSVATLKPCRDESVNFDTTENLFIEGDNLEVLKLLQKSYYGKIKMIYIDPPYNTGNEFIYPDKYSETLETYLAYAGLVNDEGKKFSTKTSNEGRFHTRWLNMMFPRLYLALNLLREDGVIFISIDDNEVSNLRKLCDEIFGEENFIANAVWQKAYVANMTAKFISNTHDHILIYCKHSEYLDFGRFDRTQDQIDKFKNPDDDPRGPWKAENLSAGKFYSAGQFEIITPSGEKVTPPPGRYWRCNAETYKKWLDEGRIWFGVSGNGRPMLKKYLSEVQEGLTPDTWWTHTDFGSNKEASIYLKNIFDGKQIFDTPKPIKLIKRLLLLACDNDSIILDFFAGSCAVADAVLDQNNDDNGSRKFIMVQLPEPCEENSEAAKAGYKTISDIGKDRIRRVIRNIEVERAEKIKEAEKTLPGMSEQLPSIDLGFKVFKLDRSNFKIWDGSKPDAPEEELIRQLNLHIDHIDPRASQEDILYELLLKAGFMLTEKVQKLEMVGKTVYSAAEGALLICLEDKITRELIDAVAAAEPMQFLCLDKGFQGNDQLKANAVQTFNALNQGRDKTEQIVFRTV